MVRFIAAGPASDAFDICVVAPVSGACRIRTVLLALSITKVQLMTIAGSHICKAIPSLSVCPVKKARPWS